ncbi:MAG: hypothetical protein ACYC0V_07940 [Armatimonadota bacterium]
MGIELRGQVLVIMTIICFLTHIGMADYACKSPLGRTAMIGGAKMAAGKSAFVDLLRKVVITI